MDFSLAGERISTLFVEKKIFYSLVFFTAITVGNLAGKTKIWENR
jgi:hypothetical protein